MSSYIQRLIARGVESYSSSSVLGSVAKSQSPLVKNDQRLHDFDIKHTVDVPVSRAQEDFSFDSNQSIASKTSSGELDKSVGQMQESDYQGKPLIRNDNSEVSVRSSSPAAESDKSHAYSSPEQNQANSEPPIIQKQTLVEKQLIHQSPVINKHFNETHINKTENQQTVNYVDNPRSSSRAIELNSYSNTQQSYNGAADKKITQPKDSVVEPRVKKTMSINPDISRKPEFEDKTERASREDVALKLQEVRAKMPVSSIAQEYDSHKESSPAPPSVVERVVEKVVEKEFTNNNIRNNRSHQSKPATAESISKIGSLPIRNSVFSIFGSRG
ncbi:hypothetical protein [Kangiella sp.]|uniref:hypothetical protein n=1 Tax=Kangiella sp. TaxID=1920245 RepID=UPI003A945DBA